MYYSTLADGSQRIANGATVHTSVRLYCSSEAIGKSRTQQRRYFLRYQNKQEDRQHWITDQNIQTTLHLVFKYILQIRIPHGSEEEMKTVICGSGTTFQNELTLVQSRMKSYETLNGS